MTRVERFVAEGGDGEVLMTAPGPLAAFCLWPSKSDTLVFTHHPQSSNFASRRLAWSNSVEVILGLLEQFYI